jgi:hypothetical protein
VSVWAIGIWLLGALAFGLDAPVSVRALLCLPAVLWAPGLGFAMRLSSGGGRLQTSVDAAWISIALVVVDLALLRSLDLGPGWLLGLSGVWLVAGLGLARGHAPKGTTGNRAWAGVALSVLFLAGGAAGFQEALTRPLQAYWWLDDADQMSSPGPGWQAADGWGSVDRPGWQEAGAGRLEDPQGDGGTVLITEAGELVIAVQGPIGTRLDVGDASAEVLEDVQEASDPEPVPRYLDHGVAAVRLSVQPGPLRIRVASPGPTVVYLFPSAEAIWAVHHEGDLRFTHKWQILNIVENQRWAAELLDERWVTINQPPLWSNVLAVSVALVHPGLAGANGLLLWVLVLLSATAVRLVEALAPRASPLAWAIPGAYAVIHLKLMVEPASTTFPDSLYAAAWVAGLLALVDSRPWRVAWVGLAAGLLRYPGTIALTLAAGVQRAVLGRTALRGLAALWGTVLGVAALFAVAALLSQDLQHWLEVLWFETVPEHYNNNQDAVPLWQRPAGFYWRWLYYTGGGLVLAGVGMAHRGARFVLGSALVYSLVLCTIDHFPTHYFLPLIALTGVSIAAGTARLRHPVLAHGVPGLALVGAAAWIFQGHIL